MNNDTGFYHDARGAVRFTWDGVEVTPGQFGDKVRELKLQNDDLKRCLRGLAEQIVADARSTGPFKITSSKGLKEAMTFAWMALEIHEKKAGDQKCDHGEICVTHRCADCGERMEFV